MRYGWPNMMGYGYGYGGWLPDLIIWVVIIVAIIALFKFLSHHGDHHHMHGMHSMGGGMGGGGDTALDILKQRYAKGEINKKEFEEMKKDIED